MQFPFQGDFLGFQWDLIKFSGIPVESNRIFSDSEGFSEIP